MGKAIAALASLTLAFFSMAANAQDEVAALRRATSGVDIFKLLRLDGNFVRWPADAAGNVTLTYKVLDEFQAFDGARNCRRMTGVAALETRSNIDAARFHAELDAAFAMWEQAANLRFREAQPGEAANITIGTQVDPEGWAFADVFYDPRSREAVKPISRALVCLNPSKRWKVGFDGDVSVYDIRYTLAHEIGHAIGLDHPNGPSQIMGYRYEESFRNLQAGDVGGAALIYGNPRFRTEEAVVAHSAGEPSTQPVNGRAVTNQASRALNPH